MSAFEFSIIKVKKKNVKKKFTINDFFSNCLENGILI